VLNLKDFKMKIVVCGSMSSAAKMIEVKKSLKSLSHKVVLPSNTEDYASKKIILEGSGESPERKIKFDLTREYYNEINNAEAVLIVNIDKNEVKNYIGGSAFMELSFGHVLNKKLFLLNPIPSMIYTDEIIALQPTILNGDLSKIK